ncbi:hypothetical protein LshimejAT787_0400940 [Lyophyllum shimeji]|uniref:Uncharacterized protein n=1 Tax=Lyophyllum shimeji TaxID=47721 RepID=A0A9P3UKV7_LYOSH|nr:hypothetical protein LshimejAT787_0400940 [Lyophyllum shimeji]
MSEEGSLRESDSSADTPYGAHFRKHLAEVREHLAKVDGEDLPPSYIPPTGFWTPLEKNIFFHSLRIYSRFRPDLVAASIGTKTVVDVCAYIDTLDQALSRGRHLLSQEFALEGAIEVSDTWVSREEQMAEELSVLEPKWERNNLSLRREEQISARKALSQATVVEGDTSVEDLGTWEHDRRKHWSREDSLSQLDWHHLKIMEGILKKAESGDLDVEGASPEDRTLSGILNLATAPAAESSDRTACFPVVGDGMIDPALLRLSGLPVPNQTSAKNPAAPVEDPQHQWPSSEAASSPLSRATPVSMQPSCYTPSLSPEDDHENDPSNLSPASRRRLQKRLYMRRKRAAQKGAEVIADVEKLRPGRRAKERKASKSGARARVIPPASLHLAGDEGAPMDVDQSVAPPVTGTTSTRPERQHREEEDSENDAGIDSDVSDRPRPNKGGLTRPYRIKREFASKEVDADFLNAGDMGLFHLSTLGRLMTLYKSGYDIEGSNAATSISADSIRLMTAILVDFTTEVVRRAVTSREQENKMKGEIKVYRHNIRDEISVANVKQVLQIMGMKGLTREKYFGKFKGEQSEMPEQEDEEDLPCSDENAEDDDEAGDEESSEDEDNDDDEGLGRPERPTVFPAILPLHRECHPPLVRLPRPLCPCSQSGSGAVRPAEEPLMPADTDEEALLEELAAEMELDAADDTIAKEYEANLWKHFGKGIEQEKQ